MERKGRHYSIDEVLSKVVFTEEKVKVDFDGDLIAMNSDRYKTFKLKGIKCVTCGIKGSFFAKERHVPKDPYHFNFYALNQYGHEILMTKDHIVPICDGGPDHIDNYQTMCTKCNAAKAKTEKHKFPPERIIEEISIRARKIILDHAVLEKSGSKWIVSNGNGKIFNRNEEWVENQIQKAKEEKNYEYLNTVCYPFSFCVKLSNKIKGKK